MTASEQQSIVDKVVTWQTNRHVIFFCIFEVSKKAKIAEE